MTDQLDILKEQMYESIQNKRARLAKVKKKVATFELPVLPSTPEGSIDLFLGFQIKLPYDLEVIKETKEAMGADGWSAWIECDNHQWIQYNKDGYNVEIRFQVNHKDSTCTKTKIGERSTTEAVYEITCKEGAEEKTFIHKETTA